MKFKKLLPLAMFASVTTTQVIAESSSALKCEDTTLEDRIIVSKIPVKEFVVIGRGQTNLNGSGHNSSKRVILSIDENDQSKIAWVDSNNRIRITPLSADKNPTRTGEDIVLPGHSTLWDMVAHKDGAAVLTIQGSLATLTRVDNSGKVIFTTTLSNNYSGSWGFHDGSLAWDGKKYAAYYAISEGGHEGDSLTYVSANGSQLGGGWHWGCSHSMDVRVDFVDGKVVPVCISDAYPSTGIYHNNQNHIAYEYGQPNGTTHARFGGLAHLNGWSYIGYYSTTDRNGYDAALAYFETASGGYPKKIWMTNTPGVHESNVKLAKYKNDSLLMSWITDPSKPMSFRILDGTGETIEGPEDIYEIRMGPLDDFKSYSNGDVGLASIWTKRDELKLVRIQGCK